MNKFLGILLIIVAVILGLLAATHVLAGVENIIGDSLDAVYILKRGAISFILFFFMYKAFVVGKAKAFGSVKTPNT